MLLDKNGAVGLVARTAERSKVIFQEMICVRRAVRIVAVQAPFLNRIVFELDLGEPVSHGFMTTETEFIPCLEQIGFVFGGVRVVAFAAIPLDHRFVNAFRLRRLQLLMTLEADLIFLFIQ
jgi:hypothetical protein